LETSIDKEDLSERDMYDAIVNLHLLSKALEGIEAKRVHTASQALSHARLVHRIVNRWCKG